jgi:hypothetical protein
MLTNENDTHVLQKGRTTRYFISQDVAAAVDVYLTPGPLSMQRRGGDKRRSSPLAHLMGEGI